MIRILITNGWRPPIRSLWLTVHRYCALGLGWLLASVALLGALLTVAKPLDRWLHPELFVQPTASVAAAAPLQLARTALASEFGPGAALTFRPPRAAGDTLWVRVRADWEGTVYFDAASGRELGRRGEHEGFYNFIFEVHSSLLLGDTGQAVLAGTAGTYLLLLLTGLVLWWPKRWPPSLRIRWAARNWKTVFDLHGTGGALLGVLGAVTVASGAYMAWPPLRPMVSSLLGDQPAAQPRLAPGLGGAAAPLDPLVAQAQAGFPGAMVGYVIAGADASKPVRVRLKLPEDPHPNGLTSVWLHPASGAVLGVQRWDRLDAGHKIISVVYPLHTGELGGPPHTALVALLGLALAGLGGSGIWLWWRRRRRPGPAGRS